MEKDNGGLQKDRILNINNYRRIWGDFSGKLGGGLGTSLKKTVEKEAAKKSKAGF